MMDFGLHRSIIFGIFLLKITLSKHQRKVMNFHYYSDQFCTVRYPDEMDHTCDSEDMGAPLVTQENDRYCYVSIWKLSRTSLENFRYTIIGVNVGFCVNLLPELFTSFFANSITTWIRTIVESDGDSAGAGAVGTGMGRVEFSICKEVEEPPTETTDHDEGYEVCTRARHTF